MAPCAWFSFTVLLTVWTVFRSTSSKNTPVDIFSLETCKEIAASVSSASRVYDEGKLFAVQATCIHTYWRSTESDPLHYLEDIDHWASSSSQVARCSFEPGTSLDVGIAVSNELVPYVVCHPDLKFAFVSSKF
jgi:hypothetical protein